MVKGQLKQPLSLTHPELAKEADGWDPTSFSYGSSKKVTWKCPKDHIYEARISNRTINGSTCPFCARKKILPGFNDLQTLYPELAQEAHGWDPSLVMPFSRSKFFWKCSRGHIWKAPIYSRSAGNGCPFCAGQKVLPGFNDLATTHPKIASEAYLWNPTSLSAGSGKKVAWQCQVDTKHIYKSTPYERVSGNGCSYCAGKRVLSGSNDLATLNPDLAREATGWDPTEYQQFSHARKKWTCKVNAKHKWVARISERSRGFGCPFCAGRKILQGDNDLLTTHPKIAAQALGWDPTQIGFGSHKYLWWQCEMNTQHKWRATVKDRTAGYGCPSCAKSGFDQIKDGYLYFLQHSHWDMLQIGITNNPEDRLKDHLRLGWEVIEIRGPMDGHLTQQWETAILRMLKAKGADLANSKIAGKFDGYSEAWSKEKFEADSIRHLMTLTEEFEALK